MMDVKSDVTARTTGAVDRLPNVAEKMDVVRAFPRGAPGEDANATVRSAELLSESFS